MNRSNLSGSAAKAVSRSRAPEVDRSLMTQSLATSLKIALPQRSSGLRGSARRSDCCTAVPPPTNGEHCRQAVKLPLTVELLGGVPATGHMPASRSSLPPLSEAEWRGGVGVG